MTRGISQFVRAYESVAADTPLADRWDIPLVTTRCIAVDADLITTMTADEWDEFVALKYGREGEE